ncbi:hypothetical protein EW146_g8414 [Bondarzewia mesenterica]|uniref:Uncharacterized protein n=1 Tax=Bondarzewia mesenterica TaxID=1095465 RepID=A0A4S4LK37_9AGAM|nr:hypothetical protein EW146_g8414 [Bondarzewia mesenterica]
MSTIFQLSRRALQAGNKARATFSTRWYTHAQQTRLFTSTPLVWNGDSESKPQVDHTAESYFKEADLTPPLDSTIHRVDSSSDSVQRPYEAPSGEWSRAGTQTEEYTHVDRKQPYDVKTQNGGSLEGEKLRYGGKKPWSEEKGPETSKPDEGPTGKGAEGRKPEGRK